MSQPVAGGATPSSESQPVVDNGKMQTSSAQDNAQTSLSSLVTASYVTSGSAVTTSAPNVGRVAIHKTSSSSLTTLAPSICTKSSTPISYAPRFNLPRATSTAVAASPMSMHQSSRMPTWSCGPRTVGLDASATEFYPANTPQQSASTYIYSAPPFEQQASPQSRMQPDPWVAVAEAIKQGPSLPKVELMKFSGDPLEYVEFVTNFRDNIENQVSDESHESDESLKRKWVDKAGDLIKRKGRADFADFVEFVRRVADRINNRYGQELGSSSHGNREKRELNKTKDPPPKFTTLATQTDQNCLSQKTSSRPPWKCAQCSGPHNVWRCRKFGSASLNDRLKTVRQRGLCKLCLDQGHTAKQCDRGFTCLISGCGKDHHYLLHFPSESVDEKNPRNPSSNAVEGSANSSNVQAPNTKDSSPSMASAREQDLVTVTALEAGRPRVCFKVVPVKIRCPGGAREIITHAFLDSGSDASLCLDSLAREIGVTDMKPISYTMTTTNCADGELRHDHEVQLEIESLEGDAKFRLENVLTTRNLPVSARQMATNEDIKRWPHLCEVSLPETGDKKVTILIGNDRPDLIDKQLDRKEGDQGEPVAVRTPLGWTVHGPIGETVKDRVHINFTRTGQDSLSVQLERMYYEEFVEADANAEEGMSVEDRKAQELKDQSATLVV